MNQRAPLTLVEREQIYQGKLQGQSQAEVAAALNCSLSCVRKWWQRIREEGPHAGIASRKRGRPRRGMLSTFDREVRTQTLALKKEHQRWGPDRMLVELRKLPQLNGEILPSRSQLALFFQEQCPECVGTWKRRPPPPSAPPQAQAVHEVWQLDGKEGGRLGDGDIATVCNIRDPYGAAMLASQAFSVKTEKHWRKLTWEEVRFVLRTGFTEWQTLPDSVLTDNELGLGGHPSDPFPSSLTLWLTGLGIRHDFIRPRTPTDQPQIERNHRTLDGFTFDEDSRANIEAFQQSLQKERHLYNHSFPSQASDCNGQPPLVAHPELLHPRRPYRPECEAILFDMQRVYDHLATFIFDRKVNANGQVSLKKQMYSIGRQHAGLEVKVNFDSDQLHWVFWLPTDNEEQHILACRPLKGLDFQLLTGLNPDDSTPTMPVQLTFSLPPS